jgi:hypothetical protein
MTTWQKLGDTERPIYRTMQDPRVMFGVKRIDVSPRENGTIIVTVETEEGTMAVDLHMDDR